MSDKNNPSSLFKILAILVLIGAIACILLLVTAPMRIPATPAGIKLLKVTSKDGQDYLILNSHPMNYPGQIQGVGLRIDAATNTIFIDQYAMVWHPFSQVETRSNWPVTLNLKDLSNGKYTAMAWTSAGKYESIGTFEVSGNPR